jgi:putative membrane protein
MACDEPDLSRKHGLVISSGLFGLDALKDLIATGAFMWVFGSVAFLIPAIYLTARLLANGRLIDEKTGLERARGMAQ